MTKFSPIGQEDPMATLCRMVRQTGFEDLPPPVVRYAKRALVDTMAVIVGGSAMEGVPALVDHVKEKGGKADILLPFYGGRVPASEAAMVIGTMARAMDLGDIHDEAGHASEYTVPALLSALGLKKRVSGKEFITAFVTGQEVLVRTGIAFRALSRGTPGRISGHYIFGPATAVGKLIGLGEEEMENAAGIVSTMTQPHLLAMYKPASLMIRVHHGFICQNAINACLLARRGITGPRKEVLVGQAGFLSLAKWETDPAALTRGLGDDWEFVGTQMKLYTSNRPTHAPVDGILALVKTHHLRAGEIAGIDIGLSPSNSLVWSTTREAKWAPRTPHECQFSLPYVVATAAFDGDVFMDVFTSEKMFRPPVRDLMSRITLSEDASLPLWGATINVTMKDGSRYSQRCVYAKGHPSIPLSDEEMVQKFRRCVPYSAYPLSPAVVDAIISSIMNLEKVSDVEQALLRPITPQ